MTLFPTKDEGVWEDLWLSAIKSNDPNNEKNHNNDSIKRWDRMASGFAKRSGTDEALKRKEKVLSMLKKAGALKQGARVLDIGSGPGNWAIPMAEAGAMVTALEPSTEMIKELKGRAEEKGVSHLINIDQRTWQEVDIEKEYLDGESFKGRFDLVFASMTPGISNPETLRKAMKASKGFCYMSSFSGGGWRNAYKEIWKELFDEEISSYAGDFIHPFNYLYSLGYRPQIEFNISEHEREETIDQAVETILFFMHGNLDVTPEIKEKLNAYLELKSDNGIFRYKHEICQALMLWEV